VRIALSCAYVLATIVFCGVTPRPVVAQEAPADEPVQVADGVYYFLSQGYISLFVVTPDGVIATDPSGLAGPERPLAYKRAIASVTDQPVRYVVYSHDSADHTTGGDVFADTATFVGHRLGVPKIAARNDSRTPVPTLVVDDHETLTLGGTSVELYYTGRNHTDNSLVLLVPDRRVLFAVDFIPVHSLLFRDLPDYYVGDLAESLRWVDENLDFDILVPGHPPVGGTKDTVREVREYVADLTSAIQRARANGLADNSDGMVAAVRGELEPKYGEWQNFSAWLPLNIAGFIRGWEEQ